MVSIYSTPIPQGPFKGCPSTHGGSGWPLGSYQREDGKVVCGICGAVCEPWENNRVPSWMSSKFTRERKPEFRSKPGKV